MTVNGRRRFVSNTGKRYYVSDMCKQDIRGEEKKKLTVEDLLHKFEAASGDEFLSDQAILG